MKIQRSFASLCLLASCCALVAATNVSVGQQPGVVRLTSGQDTFEPPTPVPPAGEQSTSSGMGSGTTASPSQPPAPMPDNGIPFTAGAAPAYGSMPEFVGEPPAFMGQQPDYTPYFGQSGGITESPVLGRTPQENPLFGPVLMWESNIGDGLGFGESYHRLNARIPYHVVPGNSVLLADVSASLTDQNRDLYNLGVVWRNYDAMRNRVFGWNAFYDSDDGRGNGNPWRRIGVGMESLGRYIDFRANGYHVTSNDSILLTDSLIGALSQSGNTVRRIRNQQRDNAYSGVDIEAGGPLPFLGRRGINMYAGAYYLDNDYGHETTGFSARLQALVTANATCDFRVTEDDTFGTNAWFSVSYTIPNYFEDKIFEPKNVRDRLADPVYRSNRVHSNIDVVNVPEALINAKTNRAWNIVYVDPNQALPGTGTFEDPFSNLQAAANANNPLIDVIQVAPRSDDTGANLTVNGGITLFECQALVSSVKDYTLFTEAGQNFVLPGTATSTNLGPLVSNPTMGPGGSVIRVTNGNTVQGLRINAANSFGDVFGTGITTTLPTRDLNIVCNTIFNYTTAANLQDVSGNIVFEENTLDGTPVVPNQTLHSDNGLLLTTAAGSVTNLRMNNNVVNDNQLVGLSVTAGANSTLNADDPDGAKTAIPTGVTGNNVTNTGDALNNIEGDGIVIAAQPGAAAYVVAEGNTSSMNTGNGFVARSDGAAYRLSSLSGNIFDSNGVNGAFLHYTNGGTMFAVSEDINEDLNFNGVLDPGEDLDLDGVLDVADGILNTGEDQNGNGRIDLGIVANTFSNNTLAGLCIFGEGSGDGRFDIGGQQDNLANTFIGNTGAGIALDLTGTATAQTNVMNNLITADPTSTATPGVTFILDFWEASQGTFTDLPLGLPIIPFDPVEFGFAATDLNLITDEVLSTVRSQYHNIPTVGVDARSPIPDGQELAVDFVVGDLGQAPSNGASEFYTIVIGGTTGDTQGFWGFAGSIGGVRDTTGTGPNFGIANGENVASIYTSEFGPLINTGDIVLTRETLGNITSHEIGHTLSLNHVAPAGSVTPTGAPPIMSSGAVGATFADATTLNEFSYSGFNPQLNNQQQLHVQQLVDAVGLRDAIQAGVSGDGIAVNLSDTARLLPSNIINNRIERNDGTGIEVIANDSARVEGLTIQGNTIQANTGRGIDLITNGPGAVINASNTIGGTGVNIINGNSFSEGNVISNNQSDGIRAVAQAGGTVFGNAFNNTITNNAGNGIALFVTESGTVDFGTPASNRVIQGNTITGNGGKGIELISTVDAGQTGVINAVVRSNDISNNTGGGVTSLQSGSGTNNNVTLTLGGTTADANTINGNGDVGVGFEVSGNALGIFNLTNATIRGTVDGPDPNLSGDGVVLRRADSSLLQATIENVTSTENAGNGMLVETRGADKNDPNQPILGAVNTVDWNNSTFTNNGQDGVAFDVRGDSLLIADGQNNVASNNAENGIDIDTSGNASFGDSNQGLPPGRRVIFDGITADNNGSDGLQASASGGSQLLLDITSTRQPAATTAHASGNTLGDSSYSNNGDNGIRIDALGNSEVDVRVTAETPVTATSGRTLVQNNGTNGGAEGGIFVTAADTANGVVNVVNTVITGTQAIGTEDVNGDGILALGEDLNGNGVLDPGEDANNDGLLDTGEDLNGNLDIDVAGGDGISYNVSGQSSVSLVVGGANEGNVIQNNADDGIAITATGSGIDTSRPTVVITNNIIGGEAEGLRAGNGGDGVSLNVRGGVNAVAPGSIDLAGPLLTQITDGTPGVEENGPIVQLTMTNNTISNNLERGVNMLFNGAAGERDRENGNSFLDLSIITLTDNTIVSNGTDGVFYRGDSDMYQARFVALANDGFPGNDRTQIPPIFYDPVLVPEFAALNVGSVNGTTAFGAVAPDGEAGYLNLRTVQNTRLNMTGNTIRNNGSGTVSGDGLSLLVGTGSYLAADIQGNLFGGNLGEDVRTASFLSEPAFDGRDLNQPGTFDSVMLDDTAQLDMRFITNVGTNISVTSAGATYQNDDQVKRIFLGFGVTDRDAGLFQIDNGPDLNANNDFINFGITQDVSAEFANGLFNLRGAADGNFPNIGFAPFLP